MDHSIIHEDVKHEWSESIRLSSSLLKIFCLVNNVYFEMKKKNNLHKNWHTNDTYALRRISTICSLLGILNLKIRKVSLASIFQRSFLKISINDFKYNYIVYFTRKQYSFLLKKNQLNSNRFRYIWFFFLNYASMRWIWRFGLCCTHKFWAFLISKWNWFQMVWKSKQCL